MFSPPEKYTRFFFKLNLISVQMFIHDDLESRHYPVIIVTFRSFISYLTGLPKLLKEVTAE